MKKSINIFIILLLIVFTSCEDYLDREPKTIITTGNFYNTDNDAIQAVNAAYYPMRELWKRTMWYIGDLPTDDMLKGGGGPGDRVDATDIEQFQVLPTNQEGVGQCWSKCYSGINLANIVITNIPDAEIDETLKSRIIAEAQYLRGYYYFILVRVFGDVPIFDGLPDPNAVDEITRDPVEDVYALIISDISSAAEFLPSSYPNSEKGRITKGAALTTLAKVHLTLENYSECINACSQVEGLGYALEENYEDLYNYEENENGKESILEVQYLYQEGFGGTNTMISEYSAPVETAFLSSYAYGWFVPSVEFFNLWDEDDQRRKATLLIPGDTLITKYGAEYVQDKEYLASKREEYINPTYSNTRKYLNFEYGNGQTGLEHGSTNMYVYRYSEVLLMHAEALNENGNTSEAYGYVNQIIERAYGNSSKNVDGMSQDELREEIFIQRRKEFFLEQKRWFDIIRRGPDKATEILHDAGKTNFDPAVHMLFPIPQSEMDLMVKWTQNPGY